MDGKKLGFFVHEYLSFSQQILEGFDNLQLFINIPEYVFIDYMTWYIYTFLQILTFEDVLLTFNLNSNSMSLLENLLSSKYGSLTILGLTKILDFG